MVSRGLRVGPQMDPIIQRGEPFGQLMYFFQSREDGLDTQRNTFEILINQTEIRLYLPLSNSIGKWQMKSDFGLIE